ncbi:uncharacterized protein LOC135827067 [Sycon ciliatum]|uniref:uncharacterized protein LOC135827067 n=1 Tax=Sycon ciliatum TaxID=27933 RepID=UPI0031F64023
MKAGPFTTPPFSPMQSCGLGTVPKKTGRLRVIHHLSAPERSSVNDGIPADKFSLKNTHVDDAVRAIMSVGRGALLTKLDIRNAFWLIPVSTDDWPLLGIHWQNQYYFEKVLPFGLRYNPFIFNQVAEAVEWILRHQFAIPIIMHYLDDYLSVSAPSLSLASMQRSIIEEAFTYLGVPLALEKL